MRRRLPLPMCLIRAQGPVSASVKGKLGAEPRTGGGRWAWALSSPGGACARGGASTEALRPNLSLCSNYPWINHSSPNVRCHGGRHAEQSSGRDAFGVAAPVRGVSHGHLGTSEVGSDLEEKGLEGRTPEFTALSL